MVQYQLQPSTSPNVGLTVQNNPNPDGISITGPSSPQNAGASLTCNFVFTNTSGGPGSVVMSLYNGTTLLGSQTFTVTAGGSYNGGIAFTMPSSDANLILRNNWNTTYATRAITATVLIGTTLTLSLSPTTVPINGAVVASGKLSRADSLTNGLSGAVIHFYKVGSAELGTTTCDANGNWTYNFSAPPTAGAASYYAAYEGSGYLTSSVSGETGIQIGEGGGFPWWLIAVGVGGYLLMKGGKKRRK